MFNHYESKTKVLLFIICCTAFFFACAPNTPNITRDDLVLQNSSMDEYLEPGDCLENREVEWSALTFVETVDTLTSAIQVAAYICQYGKLPSNYTSKQNFAQECDNKKKGTTQNVDCKNHKQVQDRLHIMATGGTFANNEKALPNLTPYTEVDVDYEGANRGKNRLVYYISARKDSCIVYHTEDHYRRGSFCQLHPQKRF